MAGNLQIGETFNKKRYSPTFFLFHSDLVLHGVRKYQTEKSYLSYARNNDIIVEERLQQTPPSVFIYSRVVWTAGRALNL